MQDYLPHRKHGTLTIRLVCAVVFLLFSFSWLYFFQADVIALAQHVLSGGQTSYDRTVGAVLLTLALWLLQLGVYALIRLSRRTHALTYLPSMLLLAVISDIPGDIHLAGYSFRHWLWVVPLALVVWAFAVWLSKQLLPFENDEKQPTGLFSRRMWLNLLQMAAMMLLVVGMSNTDAVFHFKAHAEMALLQGDTAEATRVGQQSNETDVSLTMLRLHALAREGQLGDRLFSYAVVGRSQDMLPLKGSRWHLLMMPEDSIWKAFGLRPIFKMTTAYYLKTLLNDTVSRPMVADYVLCGHLLDRDLQAFVRDLPVFYPDSLPLPRYYEEALQLARHPVQTEQQRAEENPGSYAFYFFKK